MITEPMAKRPPSARALTKAGLLQLQDALADSVEPQEFLERADVIVTDPANHLSLAVELGAPDPIHRSSGPGGIDSANGPAVYEYIGQLDPSNAADPRLWTYLAFGSYRDYMEDRWSLHDVERWKSRVVTRWILQRINRGQLVRHGIARLWWVTHLTFDPKLAHPLSSDADDPYAYTRAVFKNEDRINALFDREVGAIPPVVRAVLENAATSASAATDNAVRAVMKELTLAYGYRDLGAAPPDDITSMIASVGDVAET